MPGIAKTPQPTIPAGDNLRKRLSSLLDQLEAMAEEILSPEARQELNYLSQKLQESRFHLVLLGQVKRGKTTLLNSLLGTELLPTGILPVTSLVTTVQYGPQPLAHICFLNGTIQKVTLENLFDYATESGNPENHKGVAEAEVFYPSPLLAGGLCLIDTPGIGSLLEHNTQVAYQFVPRADAAIFVISPEAPLSRTELEFLHHIRAYVEKIFFVLNKADQISSTEETEILEFVGRAIRQQIPEGELRFLAVSARQALAGQKALDTALAKSSRIPQFIESVKQFLDVHQEAVLIRSTCASLQRLIRNELLALELEERALTTNAEQLGQKIQIIEETWRLLDQRHREAAHILRGEVREFAESLRKRLNETVEREVPRLVESMRAVVRTNAKASKNTFTRTVSLELRQHIAEILEAWGIQEEKFVQEEFARLTSRFSREASLHAERIQQVAAEQFGFSWAGTPLPEQLTAQTHFRLKVEEVVSWGLSRLPLLLPKGLFVRYLHNQMEQICREELWRNAGALMSDLGNRLEESVTTYLDALDRHIEKAHKSVHKALNRAKTIQEHSESGTKDTLGKQIPRLGFLRTIDQGLSALQTESKR